MPPRTKPCRECQRVRRKCQVDVGFTHCRRCISAGTTDRCFFAYVAKPDFESKSPDPCRRCATNNWKCSTLPGRTVCRLCELHSVGQDCRTASASLKTQCQPSTLHYYTSSESPPINSLEPGSTTANALNQLLQAFNTPILDQPNPFISDWTIEDPDLMPTSDDFQLAWSLCTANGTKLPIWFGMDGDHFLNTFFSQPAYLRLAVCAMAAHSHNPPLPESVSFSLFQRARKSLFRMSGYTPCLEMAKAYAYLFLFSLHKGQPAVGQKFLKLGLETIRILRLDVDPDDSLWLFNLTPRQKEDRRRAFWALYGWYMTDLGQNPEAILHFTVQGNGVKAPTKVLDNHGTPIFEDSPSVKWICELSEIVYKNRQSLLQPPSSPLQILESPTTKHLLASLKSTLSKCPSLLLISSSPLEITHEDSTTFKTLLTPISNRYLFQTYGLNLLTFSTLSILHRPTLYLTSLPSFTPRFLNTHHQQSILTASRQCIDSAHRIIHLFFYAESECNAYFGSAVFTQFVYHLFESCIVCWFVTCRMDPAWRGLIEAGLVDKERLVGLAMRGTEVLGRVVEIEGSKSGSTSVMFQCMRRMVFEMRGVGEGGQEWRQREWSEGLELGMSVMSLVGEDGESVEKEPYAYLGLLGFELAGGIRWKGRSEPAWRLFWKLHG
ncbi:hypothetical protein BCR33DRAFT_848388 [Rhizoclosmatium globosum]|uniref:Zn(2)-C6 fungal-type domain-containing protein n=1 Tax=Rhizoclosmatium globosum TaxID=329046 RepID=A0A1Y2CMR4_9FUNG|nr:hypothetical protein BCR33DRAFT_848388 [Rhizoclosmatium globosum]|eukprot:ORY47655.1 hypothetical protein BCR33DRAFT_848388 [Rhizoclosmatium globosum]